MYPVNSTPTTTRDEFRALAAEHRVVPVTRKVLADSETPLSAYRKLAADRPGTFLLESAENGRSWSRSARSSRSSSIGTSRLRCSTPARADSTS